MARRAVLGIVLLAGVAAGVVVVERRAIVERLLADARDRGMRTGTLQASKAGAPVYERLGFADVGFIEMWELRAPGEPEAAG